MGASTSTSGSSRGPLGMMQLRGAMIAAWDDMLPKLPAEEFAANAPLVAAALAEDGGEPLGAGVAG